MRVLLSRRALKVLVTLLLVWESTSYQPRLTLADVHSRMSLVQKQLDFTAISVINNSTDVGAELKRSIENLPADKKYSAMITHYALQATVQRGRKSSEQYHTMQTLHTLCAEMSQRSIKLDPSAMTAYLNAIVNGRDIEPVVLAVRILKSGRQLRAFGCAVGSLSTPVTSSASAPLGGIVLPEDNRQSEVKWAAAAAAVALTEVSLQAGTMHEHDLHLWANLLVSATATAAVLDLTIRQGTALRRVTAGFERLLLVDKERQMHCDAASFLLGYLLGLPCFSYQPDVVDVLTLLRASPNALRCFQQPAAQSSWSRNAVRETNQGSDANSMISEDSTDSALSTETILADLDDALTTDSAVREKSLLAMWQDREMELGRLLVWLLVPAAAEQFKYGNAYFADPGKGERLLDALLKPVPSSRTGDASSYADVVPTDAADRKALLQWAYYEATLLVRQYSALLERVRMYMAAGTSSVGECAGLIEEALAA